MVNENDILQVANAVRGARSIAVCSHMSPDGDTIGTSAALRLALLQMGKEVSWFCQDPVPDDMHIIESYPACRLAESLGEEERFDLLLCVDISDDYRMGAASVLLERCADSAQIDHHDTNPRTWTRVSAVDGDASACAVPAWHLLKELSAEITREMGVALYAAISTDTGNFSYSLQGETFSIMGQLLDTVLSPDDVQALNRQLFAIRSVPMVKVLTKALDSLRFSAEGTVTSMKLTRQDFIDCDADQQHANMIVNFGLDIAGVKATVLARETTSTEKRDAVKLSLRSVKPYDVAKVAQQFGGGGHAQAAGATVTGKTLEETVWEVEAALAEMLKA